MKVVMSKKPLAFPLLALFVAALGYFVDVYDIILFSVVRVPSLQSLGLSSEAITSTGIFLIDLQLIGMILGGLFWGIMGDKHGRLSVLFGSILLYSIANLLNAWVMNVEQYAILRFLAGFGLAGELGAGITLISELISPKMRGYAVTLITISGALGGITAGFVGNLFSWQTAYLMGGMGGFLLLFLRWRVTESTLFLALKKAPLIKKGSLFLLIQKPTLFIRYIKCLLVGVPFWVSLGFFITFSPEIMKDLDIEGPYTAAWPMLFFNVGLSIGEIGGGLLSQWLGSRKKVALLYLSFAFLTILSFISLNHISTSLFYCLCGLLGMSMGYWVIFIMMSTELFGTNFRATATVSLPNMVRGTVVPLSILLSMCKPHLGLLASIQAIAIFSIAIAFLMVASLKETCERDLNFVEA